MLSFCCAPRSALKLSRFRLTSCLYGKGKSSDATMSKTPTLYGDYASPPFRFVMITASLLKTDLNYHSIDLFKSEHKSDFYSKINPLQKVPALAVDENNVICDSHAIALYLCRTTEGQDLYPKDALQQAQVDQMLMFNATVLFPIDSEIYKDYFCGVWPPQQARMASWNDALDYLEGKLKKSKWLAGDKMSLGDICCAMTVSSLNIVIPLTDKHIKIQQWLQNLEKLQCFEINKRGLERFKTFVKSIGAALD